MLCDSGSSSSSVSSSSRSSRKNGSDIRPLVRSSGFVTVTTTLAAQFDTSHGPEVRIAFRPLVTHASEPMPWVQHNGSSLPCTVKHGVAQGVACMRCGKISMLRAACCVSHVACCVSHVACCVSDILSHVAYCPLHVARCGLHAAAQTASTSSPKRRPILPRETIRLQLTTAQEPQTSDRQRSRTGR